MEFGVATQVASGVILVPSRISGNPTARRSFSRPIGEGGVDAPSSCEAGICGTCETKVLDGEPDDRDELLTPEEQAACSTMMICASRSRCARMVLDL